MKRANEDLLQKRGNPFRAKTLTTLAILISVAGGYAVLVNNGLLKGREATFFVIVICGVLSGKLGILLTHWYHYYQFKKENHGKDLTGKEYRERYEQYYKTKYRALYEWDKRHGKWQ